MKKTAKLASRELISKMKDAIQDGNAFSRQDCRAFLAKNFRFDDDAIEKEIVKEAADHVRSLLEPRFRSWFDERLDRSENTIPQPRLIR